MTKVVCSAPTKVILSGEHAVVAGNAAVALSIDYRFRVKLASRPTGESAHGDKTTLNIILKGENYRFSWTLKSLATQAARLALEGETYLRDWCNEEWRDIVSELNPLGKGPTKKYLLKACNIFVSVILVFGLYNLPLYSEVTHNVPIAGGLGSSASFSVAMSAAALAFTEKTKNPETLYRLVLDKNIINSCAFECEKFTHGTPSGIDNSTIVEGGIVLYKDRKIQRRITPAKNPSRLSQSWRMLLIDTGVIRYTSDVLCDNGAQAMRFPRLTQHLFEAIEFISQQVFGALQKLCEKEECAGKLAQTPAKSDSPLNQEEVNELVRVNQKLLEGLGVSHSRFDEIIAICAEFGVAAKLTGSGRGGAALCIFVEKYERIASARKKLEEKGFSCFEPVLDLDGVLLHSWREK